MLGFLKSLLGPKPTTIHVLGLDEGRIQFTCKTRLKPGDSLQAVALLPHKHQFLIQLRVLEIGNLCLGQVSPPEVAEALVEDYARLTQQTHYKVESEPTHHFRRYAVRSRDLPNYKGVTTDLSIAKAKLELDGPMPLGKSLELEMDLDDHRMPRVKLRCEVISCGPLANGVYEVGVRWVAMNPRQERELESYLKELKRQPGESSS